MNRQQMRTLIYDIRAADGCCQECGGDLTISDGELTCLVCGQNFGTPDTSEDRGDLIRLFFPAIPPGQLKGK